jgi:hypothetical protein
MTTRPTQMFVVGIVTSLANIAVAQSAAQPPDAAAPAAQPMVAPPPAAAAPATQPMAAAPPAAAPVYSAPVATYPPQPTIMLAPQAPPPPPPPDPGRHLHDGFYIRTSLGLGPGNATENFTGDPYEYKWSGTTMMMDVMIGGAPVPGFILGGAFVLHEMSNPTIKYNGQSYDTTVLDLSLDMATVGLFTAVYPDPTGGLNLHAMLGYTQFSLNMGDTTSTGNPAGLSFMGGLGYDFWVSDNWSIGPDIRLAYGKGKYTTNGETNEISMFVPTLAFTATYN